MNRKVLMMAVAALVAAGLLSYMGRDRDPGPAIATDGQRAVGSGAVRGVEGEGTDMAAGENEMESPREGPSLQGLSDEASVVGTEFPDVEPPAPRPDEPGEAMDPIADEELNRQIEAQIDEHMQIAEDYPPLADEDLSDEALLMEMERGVAEAYAREGIPYTPVFQQEGFSLDIAESSQSPQEDARAEALDDITRTNLEAMESHSQIARSYPPPAAENVPDEALRLEMEAATQAGNDAVPSQTDKPNQPPNPAP